MAPSSAAPTIKVPRFTRPITANDGEENGGEAGDRELGVDPRTGQAVWLKNGRFGHYVEMTVDGAAKRASLPKGWAPQTIDLDKAR